MEKRPGFEYRIVPRRRVQALKWESPKVLGCDATTYSGLPYHKRPKQMTRGNMERYQADTLSMVIKVRC